MEANVIFVKPCQNTLIGVIPYDKNVDAGAASVNAEYRVSRRYLVIELYATALAPSLATRSS
jgi:hypothetical protein